jgi:hypothetical protein
MFQESESGLLFRIIVNAWDEILHSFTPNYFRRNLFISETATANKIPVQEGTSFCLQSRLQCSVQ